MHSHLSLFNRSQISTMPRPKTEAAAYLNAYKLTTEKARLQQELANLKQREQRIQKQLAFIESQVAEIEKGIHPLPSPPLGSSIDQALTQAKPPTKAVAGAAGRSAEPKEFDTMVLEY
jgi:hypothetical protein